MTSLRMVIWTRMPLETLINNIAFTWKRDVLSVLHLLFFYLWRHDFIINDRSCVWFRVLWKIFLKKSYFLIVRLSQIMHFKSQKYTVDHLFVHYKNHFSEFICKEIMQTRWFYIVNFWIHLQYIFIIVIWLMFIFSFHHFLSITETWQKHLCLINHTRTIIMLYYGEL